MSAPTFVAWIRANWLQRWRCWFRVHHWYYFNYKPHDRHRVCTLCRRREQASYDMSTGATLWWRESREAGR